jgi:hypothetical protein
MLVELPPPAYNRLLALPAQRCNINNRVVLFHFDSSIISLFSKKIKLFQEHCPPPAAWRRRPARKKEKKFDFSKFHW